MSTVLFNPTNEELRTQHQGVDVILKPYPEDGHVLKVDDSRARHVLNVLAPRGLTSLEYGDERDSGKIKKEKAAAGVKRNFDFKRKQVIDFNQLNISNQDKKIEYLRPAKHLKAYADEVGIKLIQPYTSPDEGQEKIGTLTNELKKKDTLIQEQKKQVSDLQGQVTELSNQMKQFIDMMKTAKKDTWVEPVEDGQNDVDEEVVKFRVLNRPQLKAWMKKNWDEIQTYPDEIRAEINERHEKLFGEPFPESVPE